MMILVLSLLCAAPTTDDELVRAREALAGGRHDLVGKAWERARPLVTDPRELVEWHLLRAQAFVGQRKTARALEVLAQALELEPQPRVAPALVALLEKARQTVLGELSIRATDDDVEVFVDGRPWGPPPLKVKLGVGKHRVEAKRSGAGVSSPIDAMVTFGSKVEVLLEVRVRSVAAPVTDQTPTPSLAPAPRAIETGSTPLAAFTQPLERPRAVGPWVLLSGGLAVALAGAVAQVWSWQQFQLFQDQQARPRDSLTFTRADAERAIVVNRVGWVGVGVGLALAAAGIGWRVFDGATVAVAPVGGGGQVSLSGRL